ncbi:MAG TPA: LD-carboxypeptidase, partial [Spirochaetota bacterium]|nr:LD-carboxypeptidase [Spirochaetota bacterium]
RCFLKLAGTKYMPDPAGKILLLESFGGTFNRISSYFAQLEQLDFFSRLSGVILGNFYEAEKKGEGERIVDYFTKMNGKYNLPLIKTDKIGHKSDSRGVLLGSELSIF